MSFTQLMPVRCLFMTLNGLMNPNRGQLAIQLCYSCMSSQIRQQDLIIIVSRAVWLFWCTTASSCRFASKQSFAA